MADAIFLSNGACERSPHFRFQQIRGVFEFQEVALAGLLDTLDEQQLLDLGAKTVSAADSFDRRSLIDLVVEIPKSQKPCMERNERGVRQSAAGRGEFAELPSFTFENAFGPVHRSFRTCQKRRDAVEEGTGIVTKARGGTDRGPVIRRTLGIEHPLIGVPRYSYPSCRLCASAHRPGAFVAGSHFDANRYLADK